MTGNEGLIIEVIVGEGGWEAMAAIAGSGPPPYQTCYFLEINQSNTLMFFIVQTILRLLFFFAQLNTTVTIIF